MTVGLEAIAVLGTALGLASKWLLGNKNAKGWALAVASALCWIAFSVEMESRVLIANNVLCLALVVRGCYKWK